MIESSISMKWKVSASRNWHNIMSELLALFAYFPHQVVLVIWLYIFTLFFPLIIGWMAISR